MKSAGILLAPFAYRLGRILRRPEIASVATRLDPQYLRGYEQRLRSGGTSSEIFTIFSIAARLSASTRDGSDKIIKELISDSNSQLLQDLVCILCHEQKSGGYFVEIGVGDGTKYSNTRLLEEQFGWNGILAEPARGFHEPITRSRRAILDKRAVYRVSGQQLLFDEDDEAGEFSGIAKQSGDSPQGKYSQYEVSTITLSDLLSEHAAPSVIDYMSIDTEGTEMEILEGLPFDKYQVGFFTIEHNFDRAKLAALHTMLKPNGYRQVFAELSLFDAWFVHDELNSKYFTE